jgi:WD40 repeat protein
MSKDFEIEKKLSFHPKGIQSMCLSENGKYLISIGNFRECTVCVWELATGKLKASSFTLDKLNDVRAMDWASEGRNLEFATVGRDQVHFWALDRDDKLEYYDVFIPKGESGEIPEITACEYIYIGESPKLLIGLTSGAIMAIEYGSFKVVLNRQLCRRTAIYTSGPTNRFLGTLTCLTSANLICNIV